MLNGRMKKHTKLLVVGAGPFGLAMAAYAKHYDIDFLMLGKPMGFWKSNMPEGMLLRSACDWHLDPFEVHTIERYLQANNQTAKDVEPLSLEFYLRYADWFQKQKKLEAVPRVVGRLDYVDGNGYRFEASLDDGQLILAKQVVIALGFAHFKHVPQELANLLPPGCYTHTCDYADLGSARGKGYLIVGGRQSAFEWAALLHEAGASAVQVSYRHPTPAFAASDWSWVNPLVGAMEANPGWFRNLSQSEKEALNHRFWSEGRLKVEPWLEPRVQQEKVTLWPQTQVVACDLIPSGKLRVRLDGGDRLSVDHIILATGYKVNIEQVPLLARGNLLLELRTKNGYPLLDEHLQTNVPGLFITSMPATQDFGPFFAFTVSVRTSAKLIGQALQA
jgi:cation diffusion facilitator CzcD-associated flavoprotein CzcO